MGGPWVDPCGFLVYVNVWSYFFGLKTRVQHDIT